MFRFRVHMWVKSYSVCLSPSYFIWHNTFKVHLLLLFSRSVMSDSLQPNGLQHTFTISWSLLKLMSIELVMPSNHLILCHPFSSCLQSFLASGSFLTSHLFQWGGQTIGASASASVLPVNIQDWFPLGWTGLIFLQSKGLSRVFSSTIVWKHQYFGTQPSLWSNSSHPYMTTGKKHSFEYMEICGQSNSSAF